MRLDLIDKYLGQFIHGKCEEVITEFPDNSIDLIMTSPPYADLRAYGNNEMKIHPDEYISWFIPKAIEFKRVLKDTGSFVLNISDKVVHGKQHTFAFELVIALTKEVGFYFVRDYIWHNTSAPPNIYSTGKYGRTKKSHEYCFWFSKSNNWYFNMIPIRKPYSHDMLKYLQGRGKGNRDYNKRPSTHSFDCEKTWKDNGGSDPGSVISIGNTGRNDNFFNLCKLKGVNHPARFPERLAEFFILSGTKENDIVLDPFCGSGTTMISAQRNRRKWIGIDINQDFCELAYSRLYLEFPDLEHL